MTDDTDTQRTFSDEGQVAGGDSGMSTAPSQNPPETRVGHTKADETDEYAGRGPGARDMTETPIGERGWLGNPFTVEEYSREESIERFRETFEDRLEEDVEFRDAVRNLHGKTLGCWCQRLEDDSPACHAEVIAEWADRLAEEPGEP